MGYYFKIDFKKERENKVAHALSRKYEGRRENKVVHALSRKYEGEEGVLAIISFPTPDWIEELKLSYSTFPELLELLTKFQAKKEVPKGYTLHQGLILKKWRFVINLSSHFKENVLQFIYNSPQAGHSGFLKTYHRAKNEFLF